MDLAKTKAMLQRALPMLSEEDNANLRPFFTTLLKSHQNGELGLKSAVDILVQLIAAIDVRNEREVSAMLSHPEDLVVKNLPSKTGNPSGGNRGNASPKY
ncbi:hypothetical protein ABRP55_11790 [Pectobacterium zantedeschiae]|uniref:hypothetical protein n=1 Tax=Pectobacterium zantedeschiae TaxID=2034769 RepID=UPI0032ED5293